MTIQRPNRLPGDAPSIGSARPYRCGGGGRLVFVTLLWLVGCDDLVVYPLPSPPRDAGPRGTADAASPLSDAAPGDAASDAAPGVDAGSPRAGER